MANPLRSFLGAALANPAALAAMTRTGAVQEVAPSPSGDAAGDGGPKPKRMQGRKRKSEQAKAVNAAVQRIQSSGGGYVAQFEAALEAENGN